MGVSTGQIFQPKTMSVVEPQAQKSAWAYVLPQIVSSLAQTAVGSYVKNKLETAQLEKEMLAKGYTKDPTTGQWARPPVTTQDLGNNIIGVMQGGELKNAYQNDPVKAQREQRIADNADLEMKRKSAEAAGLMPDVSTGLSPDEAVRQGRWKPFAPSQSTGIGGTVVTTTGPGKAFVTTGQVQEESDAEGNKYKIYPDGTKKFVGKTGEKEPTAFSDQNAYEKLGKYGEPMHQYEGIATSLTSVYGNIRKQDKTKPDAAFNEVNNMAQVASQYSSKYPTREAAADAVNRGELTKEQGLSLMKYYRYGGAPLQEQSKTTLGPSTGTSPTGAPMSVKDKLSQIPVIGPYLSGQAGE